MNPRIRELAEQSGWMMSDEVEGFNIRLEKFAELIVDEICKIVQLDGEILLPMIIKEHFGVEE